MNYIEDDEPFKPEYYKHVLSSLSINSRALITELTTLADKYIDHAPEIVQLIEERIKKCLPQYKLFSVYLLDSICKNIGNPYNLIFGSKLYNIFTQTYLVVTDTPTRQNLINLFKTWTKAQTTSGLELFPSQVIKKIEEFIIKATSINNNNNVGADIPNGNGQNPSLTVNRISPDMLLREGNYLLQYIIALNDELDQVDNIPLDQEQEEDLKLLRINRNDLILSINNICESIMTASKPDFETKAITHQSDLQNIRKSIDNQGFEQQSFLKPILPKIIELKNSIDLNGEGLSRRGSNGSISSDISIQDEFNLQGVEINFKTNDQFINNIENMFGDIKEDNEFITIINNWGKVVIDEPQSQPQQQQSQSGIKEKPILSLEIPATIVPNLNESDQSSIASSLGLNLTSVNFQDSFLGSPRNELTPVSTNESYDDDGDIDSYDPEHSIVDNNSPTSPIKKENYPSPHSLIPLFTLPSSLKRPNPYEDNERKVIKRVRFVE